MKNVIILMTLIFIVFNVDSQKLLESKALVIGKIDIIRSEVLNENRILNIRLPENYDSLKSYPVIYALDGSFNEDFLHEVGLVQFFELQLQLPEFIIVGIANVDRKRDFTYHTDLRDLQKDFPTTGHSDKFIEFVEKELQPYIKENYSVNDTKYIFGQSLGGLLASEILIKKPELFTHYFIVSPSLWWDDESLLLVQQNQNENQIENPKERNLFIYISVGADEEKIMKVDAKKLYKQLKNSGYSNLHFNQMKNENHATILHNSLYEGLSILFPPGN